jgi:hypothetical protein
VTRRLGQKSAQNCPNIAQNGALLNRDFYSKKLWIKILEIRDKRSKNIVEFWALSFFKKCAQSGHPGGSTRNDDDDGIRIFSARSVFLRKPNRQEFVKQAATRKLADNLA